MIITNFVVSPLSLQWSRMYIRLHAHLVAAYRRHRYLRVSVISESQVAPSRDGLLAVVFNSIGRHRPIGGPHIQYYSGVRALQQTIEASQNLRTSWTIGWYLAGPAIKEDNSTDIGHNAEGSYKKRRTTTTPRKCPRGCGPAKWSLESSRIEAERFLVVGKSITKSDRTEITNIS